MDLKAVTSPVGILRILAVVLTLITFSLVASVFHTTENFWTYCMFTWCFCFCVNVLIILLELTGLSEKLPISWNDFTAAFAMLASLMVLVASILYPKFYACQTCGRQIGASVTSWLCFIVYVSEVVLTRAKSGEISGFLSTIPGLLKVLEAFVACVIFICLDYSGYELFAGLKWCVAVYSICFIFAVLVVVFTICRLLALFPAPFHKVLIVCNVLAVLMYITAAVIWPLYSFRNRVRPSLCDLPGVICGWDISIVITIMTYINLIAYIVDTVYSFRLVFFIRS